MGGGQQKKVLVLGLSGDLEYFSVLILRHLAFIPVRNRSKIAGHTIESTPRRLRRI